MRLDWAELDPQQSKPFSQILETSLVRNDPFRRQTVDGSSIQSSGCPGSSAGRSRKIETRSSGLNQRPLILVFSVGISPSSVWESIGRIQEPVFHSLLPVWINSRPAIQRPPRLIELARISNVFSIGTSQASCPWMTCNRRASRHSRVETSKSLRNSEARLIVSRGGQKP